MKDMSKTIALVPVSGKPYHLGHDMLVRMASTECDEVKLFVSTSDRIKKGEIPIYGADMEEIWKKYIEKSLPDNVSVTYGGSPVRNVYDTLVASEESNDTQVVYKIYSDEEDILKFTSEKLRNYVPALLSRKQIQLRGVSRKETVEVSGTLMRQYIATGKTENFISMLPVALRKNGLKIYNILKHSTNECFVNEAKLGNYGIQNTIFSDMNEILLASAVMGGTSIDDVGDNVGLDAQNQVESRLKTIIDAVKKAGGTKREADERIAVELRNGDVSATAVLVWAAENGFGSPKTVFWTARPGALKAAMLAANMKESPTPGNPSDVAIVFGDRQILGVSAKTKLTSGDVGFKNPGWGVMAKLLGVDIKLPFLLVMAAIQKLAPKAANMTLKQRKVFLRSSIQLKSAADEVGKQIFIEVRNALFDPLSNLSEDDLRSFALDELIDATHGMIPPYIKVTAVNGGKSAHVMDPTNNNMLDLLNARGLNVVKARNDSIIFVSGSKKPIFQLRVKFESQMLASSLKFTAEPAAKSALT